MKLGLVTPRFIGADMRGGEEVIRTLAKELSKIDQVTVFTSDSVDVSAQHSYNGRRISEGFEIDLDKIKLHYLSSNVMVSYPLHKVNDLIARANSKGFNFYRSGLIDRIRIYGWGPYLKKLGNKISEEQIDILHSSLFPTTSSYQTLKYAKRNNIPFVFTPYYHFNLPNFRNSRILKYMFENSSMLIACTPTEAMEIVKTGISAEKIKTIPLSLSIDKIGPLIKNKKYSRDILGINDHFVVLTHPWASKGGDIVLKAAARASESMPTTLLTIGIPDEIYVRVKEEMSKKYPALQIIDIGWVSGSKKWLAFSACDIFALPSVGDAFGVSYLEAWAAGKPVVAAKESVQRDIITNGVNGFLIEQSNVSSLHSLFKELYYSPKMGEQIGNNGKSKLISEYNTEKMTLEYRKTFLELFEYR